MAEVSGILVGLAAVLVITALTGLFVAQLGVTVTGLVVGYVAEPLIGAGLGRLLGTAGVSAGTGAAIGTALALAAAGAGRRRPVHRALTTMRRRRSHFALVTADGEPVGLLTLHDVLARLLPPR